MPRSLFTHSTNMSIKELAIKALVFVVLLIGADQLCGWGFRKLNTISGDKYNRQKEKYIIAN